MNGLRLILHGAILTTMIAAGCGHTALDEKKPSRVMVITNRDDDRSWLGVTVIDITRRFAEKKNLSVNEGAYVSGVADDSPAERAGLREGDVIVEFDGQKIRDTEDLQQAVRKVEPGREVFIGVVRDGEKQSLKAVLERRRDRLPSMIFTPSVPPQVSILMQREAYGLTLEELNPQLGDYFGVPGGRGVLVKMVKPGSGGERAGFKAGDVIVKIGKQEVTNLKDIRILLRDYNEGDSAKIDVLRKGMPLTLFLRIERGRVYGYGPDFPMEPFAPDEKQRLKDELQMFKFDMQEFKKDLRRELEELEQRLHAIPKQIQKHLRV